MQTGISPTGVFQCMDMDCNDDKSCLFFSTSFKLLQEATLSLARHAAKLMEKTPINEAVSADMDRWESSVLKG